MCFRVVAGAPRTPNGPGSQCQRRVRGRQGWGENPPVREALTCQGQERGQCTPGQGQGPKVGFGGGSTASPGHSEEFAGRQVGGQTLYKDPSGWVERGWRGRAGGPGRGWVTAAPRPGAAVAVTEVRWDWRDVLRKQN